MRWFDNPVTPKCQQSSQYHVIGPARPLLPACDFSQTSVPWWFSLPQPATDTRGYVSLSKKLCFRTGHNATEHAIIQCVCVCARPKLDSIHLNPLWCPQYDLVWVDLSSQSWRYSTSIPCDTRRVLDIAKTDFGGLEVLAECLRP